MSKASEIGFSQRVRLEWLQEVALQVNSGTNKTDLKNFLSVKLKDKVSISGEPERGNRQKIITILLRTWMQDGSNLNPLRQDGLELLRDAIRPSIVGIHWGMVCATYPFWASVAAQVGRLLALQGTVSALQVQRRMRELLGERETVSRATRRVLRSYLDWGVLSETTTKGTYQKAPIIPLDDPAAVAWLLEAVLRSKESSKSPFMDLVQNHALFPFQFTFISVEQFLRHSPRVQGFRHGMDGDLVFANHTK